MLCLATSVMVASSWPLWLDGGDFPRVPFVRGWGGLPGRASWVPLLGLTASLGASAIARRWRGWMALALGLLVFEALGDQDRLQPWAYQFGMVGLALVALPRDAALRLARLYAITLYVHSGLSKLDASFVRELGSTFLGTGLSFVGLDPGGWAPNTRTAAILLMPTIEIAIGLGLAARPTRRIALVGAVGLHVSLLLILGPWGLDHSGNVLIWNAAMLAEDVLLFRRPSTGGQPRPGPIGLVLALVYVAYPLGERFGLSDAWPSHALYASHCERTEVYLHEDDLDRFPEAIRRRVAPSGEGPWRRLDLTGWSRDVRGTPPYPQGRVGSGLAEAIADRWGGTQPVRVIQWGRAGAWDDRRDRVECLGIRAIRRRGDRYRVNAHPAP